MTISKTWWQGEPAIDLARQLELAKLLKNNHSPFKNFPLSRADIVWLLKNHDNGRGPIDWDDETQHNRRGLDLRGAILSEIDLSNLPLACTIGGLNESEGKGLTEAQRVAYAVQLDDATLRYAHLEGSILDNIQALGTIFQDSFLQNSSFRWSDLPRAHFRGANLSNADLRKAHCEGANFRSVTFHRTDLRGAFLNPETRLTDLRGAQVADVHWSSVPLTDCHIPARLEDEQGCSSIEELRVAIRAYRVLILELKTQGMTEEASALGYRAQKVERKLFRMQRKWGKWLLSCLLDLGSGYGFKPWRCLLVYFVTLIFFAITHWLVSFYFTPTTFTPWEAFVVSVQALHVAGFFIGNGPQTVVNTIEAFIGIPVVALIGGVITEKIRGER